VIRQICPNCFRSVELPDSAAGTDAPCPSCGKVFALPGRYNPTVDPAAGPPDSAPAFAGPPSRPAPPPGFVPPGGAPRSTAPASEVQLSLAAERTAALPLSGNVLG